MFDISQIKKEQIIDGDKFEDLKNLPGITYLKTDSAIELLKNCKTPCPPNQILITHNGDYPITPELIRRAEILGFPHHWFAQNVLTRHPKLTPIPIGLERTRWFSEMRKRDTIFEYMKKSDINSTNLCLANFSLNTNRTQRKACLDNCRSYSTLAVKDSVIQEPYRVFLESILAHHFVLCPEGNGIDTHRLWETLYLGRIPVVTHNETMESFKDLPILILPSWDCLSKEVLEKNLYDFQNGRIHYTLEKINFHYWEKKINGIL